MKGHILVVLPSLFCCKPEIRTEKHYKALLTHRPETKRLHRSNSISSYYFPNSEVFVPYTKEFTLSGMIKILKDIMVE